MIRRVDLRSDTVTQPTQEMRRAMAAAEVGDDVYGEDPTVNRLEELAAEKVGKEAALFMPSGTMGNQAAVLTHTRRGEEVILEAQSHTYLYELGGLAVLSGVQACPLRGERGVLDAEAVAAAVHEPDGHAPISSLLVIENTHNRAGGTVTPLRRMRELCDVAHRHGLKVHLDGARIFNAALALGVDAKELAAPCDSVMFCLSKGLSAPVGSMLAGSRAFVRAARRARKLLGGGMRQAGVLAAAGIVALEHMVDRLVDDHRNARRLAEGLAAIAGLHVDGETVQTNIVMADLLPPLPEARPFVAALREEGVLANAVGRRRVRFVTHKDVTAEDIDAALRAVAAVARAGGRAPASAEAAAPRGGR